jgi:TRAP-type C4-dicarboxylate transport system permease small subunit
MAPGGDVDFLRLWRLHRRRRGDPAQDHLHLTAVAETLHGAARRAVEIIIRLVVLGVALSLVYFGYINFLRGFGSFRMPSMTPIASLYAAIPLSGVLIGLFTVEQLVNGLRHGFDHAAETDVAVPPPRPGARERAP